jgi:hypothetical protein
VGLKWCDGEKYGNHERKGGIATVGQSPGIEYATTVCVAFRKERSTDTKTGLNVRTENTKSCIA